MLFDKKLESLYIEASEIFYFPVNAGNINIIMNKIVLFIENLEKNKDELNKYKKIFKYNKTDKYLIDRKIEKYLFLINKDNIDTSFLKKQLDDYNWMSEKEYKFNYDIQYITESLQDDINSIRIYLKDILDYKNNKKKFNKQQKYFKNLFKKNILN